MSSEPPATAQPSNLEQISAELPLAIFSSPTPSSINKVLTMSFLEDRAIAEMKPHCSENMKKLSRYSTTQLVLVSHLLQTDPRRQSERARVFTQR